MYPPIIESEAYIQERQVRALESIAASLSNIYGSLKVLSYAAARITTTLETERLFNFSASSDDGAKHPEEW